MAESDHLSTGSTAVVPAVDRGIMTTTDEPEPLVVHGPTGLLAAIPATLGFHPRDSLVQVCLTGSRSRVGPMGRVDLDPPLGSPVADYLDGVTATLLAVARRHADRVVLVWYRDTMGRRPDLVTSMIAALDAEGITVRDVIAVGDGRFRHESDAPGEDVGCALPGPEDLDVLRLRASAAFRGRTILADREDLRRSIDGPRDPGTTARAGRAFATAMATAPPGIDDYAALLDLALLECASTGALSQRRSAAVVRGLSTPVLCDHLVARAVDDRDQPWTAMLAACARNTPDVHAGDLCALLALAAYCEGDGALAQVAVDRSLRARSGHGMARLLVQVMAAGIHPRDVAAGLRGVATRGPGR